MKKLFILFVLFLCLYDAQTQSICNYKYRKRITFDPARVAGPVDLANFQALISITADNDLRTTANGGHVENASGYDILFAAADGVTVLNHQMESYTATSGKYIAWVNIPMLSTSVNTYIYMYYGNAAATTDPSTTAIWSNYYGVWHFHNNNVNDNSGNGHTGTNNGTTNQSPAMIGDGRALNNSWIEYGAFPNITTNFTISGWANTTDNTYPGQRIFCDDVNNTGGYSMSIADQYVSTLRYYSRGSSNVVLDSPGTPIANNTWYYCVGVADITGGIKRMFINGVEVANNTFSGWGTDAGNASIGGETAGGETANRFKGMLDEVRVARTALSADWIATEYNNQSSPSTFYSISSEPYVWNGASSTDFNTAGNWVGGVMPPAGSDIIINNVSNQPVMSANYQCLSTWIKTGATLNMNTRRLSARFDITNCGTVSGGTTGELRMNSTTHIQNQYISGGGTYNLHEFTVDNTFATSPAIILLKDISVKGLMTLTSGVVYTTMTNILNVTSTGTSTSGSAASFVSGPMTKDGTANFVFPVGKSRWRRAAISNLSATATFRVEYFNTPYSSTVPVAAPLDNVSSLEYWQVDRIAGSGNANLTLHWENAALSGITNCPDLTIARWNGAIWQERPATATGTCTGAGTGSVTSNAVITAFSPFTFGSKTGGMNPLPITLLDFDAVRNGDVVNASWMTASENGNDYFTLEKSRDGHAFDFVKQVDGAGYTNETRTYAATDIDPYTGTSYYRLKQTDFDGNYTYSHMVPVHFGVSSGNAGIFPNPGDGSGISLLLDEKYANLNLTVYDVSGRMVFDQHLGEKQEGIHYLTFPAKLPAGVYQLVFGKNGTINHVEKMVVQ